MALARLGGLRDPGSSIVGIRVMGKYVGEWLVADASPVCPSDFRLGDGRVDTLNRRDVVRLRG